MVPIVLRTALTICLVFTATDSGQAAPSDLFDAINKRLSFMQAVAAWKQINNRPVEDLEREKVVLGVARDQAMASGLSGASVTDFFQSQIDAAKEIQTCWIARWQQGEPLPEPVPDLIKDVRPALLDLGNEILAQIAREEIVAAHWSAFDAALTVECLSPDSKRALFDALTIIRK